MSFYHGKSSIHVEWGDLSLGAGWYSGENFVLAKVQLFEIVEGLLTLIDISIAKFNFSLNIDI